jgi:hypothetical protein
MQGLIAKADETYTQPGGKHAMEWTTDDLADFVQGLVECGVEHLYTLRPENVKRITDAEANELDQVFLRLDD